MMREVSDAFIARQMQKIRAGVATAALRVAALERPDDAAFAKAAAQARTIANRITASNEEADDGRG